MSMATAMDFDDARRSQGDGAVLVAIDGAKRPAGVSATPFRWRDPRTIPQRPWVYGRQLLRGTVSVVIAPGAAGKTALLTGVAMSLVTARPLLGKMVWGGPQRVWIWNLEDSREDLDRLILAAALHWNITEADIGDRLFVDSAIDGAELKMAVEDREGFRIIEPLMEALTAELIARKIDVLIVDPFISSHSANENDNRAIDAIAKKWARVAVAAKCCIVLSHHAKKLGGTEVTVESSRGASALAAAARSVLTLNRMAEDEATRFGIERDERRRFFRTYDDKNNRAPPADQSDWFQLASVNLWNGANGAEGDSIQVVLPWTPPEAFDGVTLDHLRDVQKTIDGGDWLKSEQSPQWVGHAVATVLDLDARKDGDRARIRKLLKTWLENGSLEEDRRQDKGKGRERPYIVVGRWADDNSPPGPTQVGSEWGSGERSPHPTAPIKGRGGGGGAASAGVDQKRRIGAPVFPEPRGMILAPGETGDEHIGGWDT
jgi:hypothetical protein